MRPWLGIVLLSGVIVAIAVFALTGFSESSEAVLWMLLFLGLGILVCGVIGDRWRARRAIRAESRRHMTAGRARRRGSEGGQVCRKNR